MGSWFHGSKSPTWQQAAVIGWSRMLRAYILNHKQESESELEMIYDFKTSGTLTPPDTHPYTPGGVLPPERPYFINLPKQYHLPGTKNSNI